MPSNTWKMKLTNETYYNNPYLMAFYEYIKKMNSFISQEEKTEYMKTVNFHKLGELDEDLLKQALEYVVKG